MGLNFFSLFSPPRLVLHSAHNAIDYLLLLHLYNNEFMIINCWHLAIVDVCVIFDCKLSRNVVNVRWWKCLSISFLFFLRVIAFAMSNHHSRCLWIFIFNSNLKCASETFRNHRWRLSVFGVKAKFSTKNGRLIVFSLHRSIIYSCMHSFKIMNRNMANWLAYRISKLI